MKLEQVFLLNKKENKLTTFHLSEAIAIVSEMIKISILTCVTIKMHTHNKMNAFMFESDKTV